MRAMAFCLLWAYAMCSPAATDADYRPVPGGTLISALSLDGSRTPILIAPFAMRAMPVTVHDYIAFLDKHPEWRRDRISSVYASKDYLASWTTALTPGPTLDPQQAVTEVSWFAARAYCASEVAHLPSWYQWEFAAAGAYRTDVNGQADQEERILQTLLARTGKRPGKVGLNPGNQYGLHDMNTLVWEWVDDYEALFVNADARDTDQSNLLQLCGGAALAFENRSAYPLMMRVAALSAMKPTDASGNIGFRCVRDTEQRNTP
jgi:formylglycine-generating enzyme required for sulfatase activity